MHSEKTDTLKKLIHFKNDIFYEKFAHSDLNNPNEVRIKLSVLTILETRWSSFKTSSIKNPSNPSWSSPSCGSPAENNYKDELKIQIVNIVIIALELYTVSDKLKW